MSYAVKEVFATLQGEGGQAGRRAVFCRFSGCNLWSGREKDRAHAVCKFCDTDFVGTDGPGGGRFGDANALAEGAWRIWTAGTQPGDASSHTGRPYIVCTGGEPLLQLDEAAIAALHERGFEIAIETNGTLEAPATIDWICVSPKAGAPLVQRSGQELKLVFPQPGSDLDMLETLDFERHYLQPLDDPDQASNLRACLDTIHRRPKWRLSLQTHKMIGIA